MASNLSARLRRLELCAVMLGDMHGRMEHLCPTVQGLITSLKAQERFSELAFLKQCGQAMLAGEEFSTCWRRILSGQERELGKEGAAILASLGDVLGRTDLESQLSAIALAGKQLEERVAGARERVKSHGSLYRAMGVLGGVAAVIILV